MVYIVELVLFINYLRYFAIVNNWPYAWMNTGLFKIRHYNTLNHGHMVSLCKWEYTGQVVYKEEVLYHLKLFSPQ